MSFFTVPMIPLAPILGAAMNFRASVGGAWIGGTVDTTGAVIATAGIFGDKFEDPLLNVTASETAAIVKMLQNSIMGLVCLVLSVAVLRSDNSEASKKKAPTCGSYMMMLWDRFPKFVIGFLFTSILISYCLPSSGDAYRPGELEAKAISWSFCIGEWVGTMGFVAIGLNIRFAEMWRAMKGPNLVVLYLLGQSIDLVLTGVSAYLAFDYLHDGTD